MLKIHNLKTSLTLVGKNIHRALSSLPQAGSQLDATQDALMREQCILVDESDKVIGSATKRDCHRLDPASGKLPLHRAFSVLLFNSKGEFLLQKRSRHKITFPNTYTNTCCSHPLYEIENERQEDNALGIRLAAIRRLNYEMGIPYDQLNVNDFHYLTRLIYFSEGDGKWGEHEIDYILIVQKDVDINPNPNEISEVRYIQRKGMDETLANLNGSLTPWFHLIHQNRLKLWWDNLHDLKKFEDHKNIQRFD